MNTALSVLPSIFFLGLAALAAFLLATERRSPPENISGRLVASRALTFAIALQSIHFSEEAATGFHRRFPDMFGLPEISFTLFVGFNLVWIGVWIASVQGLRSEKTWAFFAAWFLAIAAILNGVAHPLLAVTTGGYFPGLVSSPFVFAAGIWLWLQLFKATGKSLSS